MAIALNLLPSCSSQKDTFTNRLYHNTTAKFNAYYYAKEKILELEDEIENEYQEDFSQVLPVFYTIDSATIESKEELLKEAREMASKAVDWHKISKWVDPSYYLIGKVDYYRGQYEEAQNTFKFLNVNSEQDDVRHIALIQLLRSFIDHRQFEDASFVIDFLSKEENIIDENKQYLYKTLAYYYEARGEMDLMAPSLFKSLEYTTDNSEASRINFILAQLYQKAGLDAFAYEYYQKSVSGSPNYERIFFAQLYSQQVAELERSKDLKRVRDYYDDLYKDNKNVDFRDVILFEKGRFEKKQGNLDEAIRLYSLATKEITENDRQKGYIYEALSDLFLNEKEDFLKTKYYLDSALTKFKETDKNYGVLAAKKIVFDQYALNYELLTTNDSLIQLSQLSPEAQEKFIDEFLAQEEERLIREAEMNKEKKTQGVFENLLAFGSSGGGSGATFYWDNTVAIQKGALEFTQMWGNRPLTDNWRSSDRGFQEAANSEGSNSIDEKTAPEDENTPASITTNLPDRATLLNQIPNSPEIRKEMLVEMEEAYFNLGKLLYFDLKQPEKSIEYLQALIEKYPETLKKPEAYYTLFLATKDLNKNAGKYALLLNQEFPDSQFTKSINNPEKVSGSQANLASGENYKIAYGYFQERRYEEAKNIVRQTLNEYPLTKNTDRLLLLDIMITGQLEPLDTYKTRLRTYLQQTKEEELLDFAEKLLKAVSEDEGNAPVPNTEATDKKEVASDISVDLPDDPNVQSPYKENLNQTHIFILPMNTTVAEKASDLTAALESFHNSNFSSERLRTGTISLGRDTTILIISPFSNSEKSLAYKETFLNSFNNDSLTEEIKNSSFVISIENFQQLNKRKDIEEYRSFYKKAY
ncbi:gliding motility protein [Cyclobacterium qasimii]|uniref:Gliding motility protein n=1 Tax=Cyclobacterium qasimii TaxID=1350429 RepID=A0A512CAY3_9BACT|nr:gliding motility protein [Cyclobacterium qasimii]